MSWHDDGYSRGHKDGLDGEESKATNRYILDLIFDEADYEEEFWDGYEQGYENGKEERESEEEK
jgi:hypothetical protein